MDTQQLQLFQTFEDIRQEKDGMEFWYARDLQKVLWYSEWRNFEKVISKAKESIETQSGTIDLHFVEVNKMADLGAGTQREIQDIVLTRYACYLIAINGATSKPEIAFAQKYFVTKARSYEVLEQKMEEMERLSEREKQSFVEKEFGRIAIARWVDSRGIAKIKSVWDKILFGGNNTQEMKDKYGVTDPKKPLADFLPAVLINAKWLAMWITNINAEKNNLEWESPIGKEHMQNNDAVRKLLKERWIIPENLPPAEDIKEIQKRHTQERKALEKWTKKKLK